MSPREAAVAVAMQAPLPDADQLAVLRGLLSPELTRRRRKRRLS